MYAEIKSNSRILINRLDENEAILLKDIADKAKDSTIEIKEITNETGDFGGIFLDIIPKVEEAE